MHHEALEDKPAQPAARETVLSICDAGVLETKVTLPSQPSGKPPLLALHGISRNAVELADAFASAAEAAGRIVVVPHLTANTWPVFQRITRKARPDKALLALMATLRTMDPAFTGPMDVFGFSGGAQLAHRFAMLYPEAVGDLHLGAAGWYTLPDDNVTYPYGVGCNEDSKAPWSRLMRDGLRRFLARNITVYIGTEDTTRDASLRQNNLLDAVQGKHRIERAQRYVASINENQAALGLPRTASLDLLPGCGHDLLTCATTGGLAARVLNHH